MLDTETELEALLNNFYNYGLPKDDFEEAQECADTWHEYNDKVVNTTEGLL